MVDFNGFRMSPLLLAIQTYQKDQKETTVIEELIKNYADLNFKEEKTGFNPVMMACHLNTESDALTIIKLLVTHKYF